MEVPESPRFLMKHFGIHTIRTDVSKVLLLIMPMHNKWINRGESLLYRGKNLACVTGTYNLPVYVFSESKVSCSRTQRCGGGFKPRSLALVSNALPLRRASQKINSVCIYIDPIALTHVCVYTEGL